MSSQRLKKFFVRLQMIGLLLLTLTSTAYAIQDSQLAKGTEKLIGDINNWLLAVILIVGPLLIVYFLIRKMIGDEMTHKKWNDRMIVAIVCTILGSIITGLIPVILGYYQ